MENSNIVLDFNREKKKKIKFSEDEVVTKTLDNENNKNEKYQYIKFLECIYDEFLRAKFNNGV